MGAFLRLLLALCLAMDGAWASTSGACVNGDRCEVAGPTLRWWTIGDWGGLPVWPYYSYAQSTVAETMGVLAADRRTDFQFALGDNFYFLGVENDEDERFQDTFEAVFTAESLETPWYVLAGNHDHYGNVSAQISYSARSQRWTYPALHYTIHYQTSEGTTVDFVLIDTIQLCGNTKDLTFSNVLEYLETRSFEPQGPKNASAAEAQWRWLDAQLAASTADFLFVAGHYPVWSIAEHGPINCLVQRLKPLLAKHKVSAYISGHDHTLQHLSETGKDGHRVHYLVSGAAGFIDSSKKHVKDVPTGSLHFQYPESKSRLAGKLGLTRGGLLYAALNASHTRFEFLRGDGRSLHHTDVPKRSL